MAFIETMEENFEASCDVDLPFLILHGSDDMLCNVEGSRHLFMTSRTEDKSMHIYPNAAHQLYLEVPTVRNDAIMRTTQFILDRI